MQTQQLTFSDIDLAAELLGQGEAVVFPTDTVYGVAVNPFSAAAIAKLYDIKMRPQEKGIPILMSNSSHLARVSDCEPSGRLERLMSDFWPGPLTIIVPRRQTLPAAISSNDGIAVRVPDHPLTQSLIEAAGGALAVSSANISGQPAATSAEDAFAMLSGRVAAVVFGSELPGALPSTIIDCRTEAYKIVREGPLTAESLGL